MTSQTIPRGHHPAPRRGKVLDTKPKLGAPCGFQWQDKTQWETEVLTPVLVREGSLGPRVPVNWRVQMPRLSPWGLVGWVGVGSGLGLGSLAHMLWPSFEAVSMMFPGGSVLLGWRRTTFGDPEKETQMTKVCQMECLEEARNWWREACRWVQEDCDCVC
jgi:hypothetical protein